MKAFNTYMFQQNVSLTIHNTTDDKKFFAVFCCLIINERIFVNITKHKDKKQEKNIAFSYCGYPANPTYCEQGYR